MLRSLSSSSSSAEPISSNPTDAQVEEKLRQTVTSIFCSEDFDRLTVKKVRASAAEALAITEDFFKDAKWKDKSKDIVTDEVVR